METSHNKALKVAGTSRSKKIKMSTIGGHSGFEKVKTTGRSYGAHFALKK